MKNYLESQIAKFVGNSKCEQLDVTELNIDKVICLLETSISANEGKITKQMEAVAKTLFRARLTENEYRSIESHRMHVEVMNLFEALFPNQDMQEAVDFIQRKEILAILEEAEEANLFLLKFEDDFHSNEYFFLKENDGLTVFERENGTVNTNFDWSFKSKYNVQYDIELPAELKKALKMQ